ncbi:RHS repeat-associated core domain-containing protein, partial [Kitasatospora sp. NPDC088548]|uniref:RHS repeat-associated core domain-containing protein n=1 Tax=Kitasatospora sp. NPDC088548 TaxID=3364075 RepID=UPI00382650AF
YGRLITDGTTAYTYDGLDRVTTRNAARFSYDGGSNNLTGDGTWSYARDSAGNLLGATDGTTNLRVRTDQHTDATATLDTNGTSVTGTTTYDPFGKPTATSGTRSSLGYQSGWTDPTTGDVNMHARWYRPGTGGFTSRDSWQLDPTPSAQADRYTYVNGNPLGGTDPSGHERMMGYEGAAGGPVTLTPTGAGNIWSWGKGSERAVAGGSLMAVGGAVSALTGAGTAAVPQTATATGTTTYFDEIYWEKVAARDWIRPPGPGKCLGNCRVVRDPPRPPVVKPEPPKPLWEPFRTTIQRPTPKPDWEPPKSGDILKVIAAIYNVADLLEKLNLDQNATPDVEAEDQEVPAVGPGSRASGDRCDDGPRDTAQNVHGNITYFPRERFRPGPDECRATGAAG